MSFSVCMFVYVRLYQMQSITVFFSFNWSVDSQIYGIKVSLFVQTASSIGFYWQVVQSENHWRPIHSLIAFNRPSRNDETSTASAIFANHTLTEGKHYLRTRRQTQNLLFGEKKLKVRGKPAKENSYGTQSIAFTIVSQTNVYSNNRLKIGTHTLWQSVNID